MGFGKTALMANGQHIPIKLAIPALHMRCET